MGLPSERNRAANQNGPLLIIFMLIPPGKKVKYFAMIFSSSFPERVSIHTLRCQTGPNAPPVTTYHREHNITLTGRQGTSFLRSGHWFVACEPQQRHPIRRGAQTHLQYGLLRFNVAPRVPGS